MDREDVALLRESLTGVVATAGDDLEGQLAGFGWHELLSEAPDQAVGIVATLQGHHLTSSTIVDQVVLEGRELTTGDARVAFPPLGRSKPCGRVRTLEGSRVVLDVDAVVTATATPPTQAVVPVTADGAVSIAVGTPERWVSEGSGLEPSSGWGRLDGELVLGDATVHTSSAAAEAWDAMVAAGRRHLAHEMIGIGDQMLRMTLDHVTSRQQFGRSLAEFQVVKHKLADVRLWKEVAELAAEAAWEQSDPTSAALAKSLACRFSVSARTHCQQLLGGMGFSWEHAFHRYLRRALLLEGLLGRASDLHHELGTTMHETGTLPQLAHL